MRTPPTRAPSPASPPAAWLAAAALACACNGDEPGAGETAAPQPGAPVDAGAARRTQPPGQDLPRAGFRPLLPSEIPHADGELTPRDVAPFPGERFTWMRESLAGWTHMSAESGEYRLPETVCGGVVLFDCDGDRDLDVFLVNTGNWEDAPAGSPFLGHALFRNDGGLRFTDVARARGVEGERGAYCTGATAADFDGDGDQDLFVTGLRRSFLYVNEGERFVERARELGVAGEGQYATAAAFLDADRDGRLDLYVACYVEFSIELNRANPCGVDITGIRDYCSPREYLGVQDRFHRQVDGRFVECARDVGMQAVEPLRDNCKGLGVIASDVDDDGDVDVYVANDGCANLLFVNDGSGRFEECAATRGCAFGESGRSLAGMGVDAGDHDGDGDFDLVCVNLSQEMNNLYENDGRGFFSDEYRKAGFGTVDRGHVGFGTDLFDFDHDGDLDLLVANGHVLVNARASRGDQRFLQEDHLLENDGAGRFRLVAPQQAGAYFTVRNAARGLATGDLDGDGDLDVVIVARDEPAVLLRNNTVPSGGAGAPADAFLFELRGTQGNRDAVGAKLTLTIGGRRLVEEMRAGGSYCSRNDLRVHFGSGGAKQADSLEVRWPGGGVQRFGPLASGREYRVIEGAAEVEELAVLATR